MKKYLVMLFSVVAFACAAQSKSKTENLVLITLDGFRWQEVFKGGDSAYMGQQSYLNDPAVREKYWRNSLEERRKALLPFFWNTIATQGQLYGNRAVGSKVNVTNNQLFSYPGYNEILTGKADNERIHSNDKIYNPNTNVLEFINHQQSYKDRVAAFSSWDVFPYIINDKRSGVFVSTGAVPVTGSKLTENERMMNKLILSLPNPLGDVRLDAFTFYYGLEFLKKAKPRVIYFAFDETDDFAHSGEYAAYLNAAHYTDGFVSELWDYLQSDEQYKNKTTIVITCDHGRGTTPDEWKSHGQKIPAAGQIWFAVIGPDTPKIGEVKGDSQLYQNQLAKTMAALLGLDFKGDGGIGEVIVPMTNAKQ